MTERPFGNAVQTAFPKNFNFFCKKLKFFYMFWIVLTY